MKAVAIIALVFSALSIFIPMMGVFVAMLCSVLALISFRWQPTLSGITFGINIIATAFLSPSLMVADVSAQHDGASSGSLYGFYVGFHIVLFIIAIALFFIKRKKVITIESK